ncbi:hypothetical protein GCM10010988_25710 [Cnuibacter physcomitrellae]|uniref:Uncharacterized protein n=1 Tax=Cnuibacter physcomitrellae TaxID=1619308 RepID=A0A1X9LIZ5_9MICO|nr:hypothetical protein [Cnuibacter physcomitrellae]ARJ03901.1 hypothetical protein B5808_00610 [Cnuibacter physcomitrellae]GGI39766.1 hypothetical protein GCM10010988_25710 [Cnuibacter physcomitrellae]
MVLELLEATGRLQDVGAILYVLYSVYKELRWRPLSTRGEWGMPTILGLIGGISLLNTGLLSATPIEWILVGATVALALVCGVLAGCAARFRPLSDRDRASLERRAERGKRSRTTPLPVLEVRTGWIGAVLWAVTLGSRYGAEYLGEHLEAPLATTTGLALLLVAVNEAGRVIAVSRRAPRGADAVSPA